MKSQKWYRQYFCTKRNYYISINYSINERNKFSVCYGSNHGSQFSARFLPVHTIFVGSQFLELYKLLWNVLQSTLRICFPKIQIPHLDELLLYVNHHKRSQESNFFIGTKIMWIILHRCMPIIDTASWNVTLMDILNVQVRSSFQNFIVTSKSENETFWTRSTSWNETFGN